MNNSFDRYSSFRSNGKIGMVPYVDIRKKSTDKYIKYIKNSTRLDKISYEYYENPDYGWLIMQSNPEYGSIENFIPDGVVLRIPYPLQETLDNYLEDINKYKEINY
jgi:hypothetical protein